MGKRKGKPAAITRAIPYHSIFAVIVITSGAAKTTQLRGELGLRGMGNAGLSALFNFGFYEKQELDKATSSCYPLNHACDPLREAPSPTTVE